MTLLRLFPNLPRLFAGSIGIGSFALVVGGGIFSATPVLEAAAVYTLDFDDPSLVAGQVIDNEFLSAYGITISANGVSTSSPDVAVLYDSDPPTGGDSDLEYPYVGGGNYSGPSLENLLIIQENGTLDGPGEFLATGVPDDDGAGGTLTFAVNPYTHGPFAEIQLHWVDIDPLDGGDYLMVFEDTVHGLTSTVRYDQFVTPGNLWYDPTIVFGDHTANLLPNVKASDLFANAFVAPTSPMEYFDRITFVMASSATGASGSVGAMGISQLDAIPEPARVVLPLMAGMMMLLHRRRRVGQDG